jgi:8-amino-7-oxononanoate synthase
MDGDRAPLLELCEVVAKSGAYLIVDEAHATGVLGPKGGGLVAEHGLEALVLARVHTFGKALGYRGGVVVCDRRLREFLINTAKPFIYSTAPDFISLELIREAYRLMIAADSERAALKSLVNLARTLREEYPEVKFLDSDTQIQGVFVADNHAALLLEERLLNSGVFARAIRAPTVPAGSERLRLCLHSFNTESDLRLALDIISGRDAHAGVVAHG